MGLRRAPEPKVSICREIRPPSRSWWFDETYVRVADIWTYLYRAVNSRGETIDLVVSPKRNVLAAEHLVQMAFWRPRQILP